VADTIRPYAEIDYLVADRIATITLSRPDQLNAFTLVMRVFECSFGEAAGEPDAIGFLALPEWRFTNQSAS